MESKKISFFQRAKRAITNFDAYQNFSMEKLSIAVKYFIKLMIIFALALAIALTLKTYWIAKDITQKFEADFPDFKFENNQLVFVGAGSVAAQDAPIEIGDDNDNFGIIMAADGSVNPDNIDMSKVEYNTVAIVMKDRVVIKNKNWDTYGIDQVITYNSLANYYNVNNWTKEGMVSYLNGENMTIVYGIFFIAAALYTFIVYSVTIFIDVAFLAVLGYLVSRIFRINFKFKPIFNMSFYALTLSIVLYMMYLAANALTGFEITYFRIGYNLISYIYLITAILMIKSDLIKQQMELMKIIEVQKQVKKDLEEEKEKKEEEKKDKEKEGDAGVGAEGDPSKKDKEKKKEPKPEPEGGQAIQ